VEPDLSRASVEGDPVTAEVVLWVVVALVASWHVLGIFALRSSAGRMPAELRSERPRADRATRHAVSILKPLRGTSAHLADNLVTFFAQRGAEVELLFGVEDPGDPAVEAVEASMRRYPHVRAKLIVTGGADATNPKVRNLIGLLPHASHDLLLISDDNVSAPVDFVAQLCRTYESDEADGGRPVGLVTCAFSGSGEQSLGGALDAVRLNGFVSTGTILPTLCRQPLVIGKTMLFSKHVFAALGGFERLADVLAEDYVTGRMFHHAGFRVAVAPTVAINVLGAPSVRTFAERHLRWAMLRCCLHPWTYVLELVTGPISLGLIAVAVIGPWGALLGLGLAWVRDLGGWWVLRGTGGLFQVALMSPLAEVVASGAGLAAPWRRHVSWRGTRLRVGLGTVLYPLRRPNRGTPTRPLDPLTRRR
jgi:ceramide glucosyltransferase